MEQSKIIDTLETYHGLAVLFAGVGFFRGTAGAIANEIGIPFAGVQVLCGGANGVASEVCV